MTDMPRKDSLSMEDEILLQTYFAVGLASAEIAAMTGLPLAVVAWRRTQLGHHRSKTEWTKIMDQTLREMREDGRTIGQIRVALACSRTAVYERLVYLGISRRPRTEETIRRARMRAIMDDIIAASAPPGFDPTMHAHALWVASRALSHFALDPRVQVSLRDPS